MLSHHIDLDIWLRAILECYETNWCTQQESRLMKNQRLQKPSMAGMQPILQNIYFGIS